MRTAELRSICQKGEGELFLISAYVYRPFTIYISRLYISLGLKSNTITFHSLIAGLAAAGLALCSAPACLFASAFFLQAYFILDHVDGEVARFNVYNGAQKLSLAGDFFDFWTHFHTVNIIFSFLGLGLLLETGNVLWAVVGIVASNISGNFQRMPMANVVLSAIAKGRADIHDPKLAPVLDVCCGLSQAKRFAGKLPPLKKVYLLASEFLGFPGNVIALTVVLVGDGLLTLSHPGVHYFRGAYLLLYCAAGLLSKTARTIISIRQLKEVSLQ